jgi:cytidylate kinase
MEREEAQPASPVARFACLRPAVIALDGPAASGKSTVGYRLASLINYLFFDTGALYRAVTWAALDRGVAVTDEAKVSELARNLVIDVSAPQAHETDGRQCTVFVDGQDVTWLLRAPAVDQNVSAVSAYAEVRQVLSAQQRRIGEKYGHGLGDKAGVVMVGRDIGSVVMPDIRLKFYLVAKPEERARRRYLEQQARNVAVDLADLQQELVRRDRIDSERVHSPLRPAADAILVDTTNLEPEQVVERILALSGERMEITAQQSAECSS